MCRVIAVSNQKGGVGKTVSCVNLGIGLAQSGKKVLLIDADPQGSMTISLGYPEPDDMEYSLASMMMNIVNKDLYHFSRQVKLKNASNITKEIAEAGYRLYKESYRLPADEREKQNAAPELFQKPLRSIGIRGTDLVTDYFWEQLDLFSDPDSREKQMKVDEAVDIIRKRFGFYSIQRGLMYRDRVLSACDAKADHTVHPHGYFG